MGGGTGRGNAGGRLRTGPLRSAGKGSGCGPAGGCLLPQSCLRGAPWSLLPIIDPHGQIATDAWFDFHQRRTDDEISESQNILMLHGGERVNRLSTTLKQRGCVFTAFSN